MESFTLRHLSFSYPEQATKALDNITFSVNQGEFMTLIGPSGCGKTTLLRQLKTVLAPHGRLSGEILFAGRPLAAISQREQSGGIGFVLQNPDNQLVTDKVWHELAFGLESLGYDTPTIRRRVAEMSSFFGIQNWFYQNVSELSGGQKQLLNLASIMAMQPSVLVLDEPTSQLDPISAADFLATVGKINRELGVTIILTEHRLDEALPLSSRLLVMEQGRLIFDGNPQAIGELLRNTAHSMFQAMPVPMRISAAVHHDSTCPLTVREGRLWLEEFAARQPLRPLPPSPARNRAIIEPNPVVAMDDIWFKYEKGLPDVIKGLSLRVNKGEFLAILGGNGTGKSTVLSLISGIRKPYRGRVLIAGQEAAAQQGSAFSGLIGMLPQNPQTLFVKKTLAEDLAEMLQTVRLHEREKERRLAYVARLCRVEDLLSRHPFDLSGGEQQRAALAKVLLLQPKLLLLDEPTKGLDAAFKQVLAGILAQLLRQGVTVIMASHDIEFCAKYAHRCALCFDGGIATEGEPRAFFSGNSFYTTAANRMARQLLPEAVTAEDVIAACGGELPPEPPMPPEDVFTPDNPGAPGIPPAPITPDLPLWRKLLAVFAGCVMITGLLLALSAADIPRLMDQDKMGLYLLLLSAAFLLAIAVSRRESRPAANEQTPVERRKLSRRTLAAAGMILLFIPLTIFVGIYYLDDRKYYFISLLVILETMLPFCLIFEQRKPQARELIIIAVLCALAVAGRAAFFMLPQFKPVLAIVIISGVAFGAETGFLVGAATMLVSNMMFGQGPWTPWQMFAMGLIGFLAGLLFRKGLLCRGRLPLCIFGGLSAILIYGGLMNPALVLIYQQDPTWQMFLLAYMQGFPFDVIHAAATAVFLWFLSQPLLEKLDRIKVKYGLTESKD